MCTPLVGLCIEQKIHCVYCVSLDANYTLSSDLSCTSSITSTPLPPPPRSPLPTDLHLSTQGLKGLPGLTGPPGPQVMQSQDYNIMSVSLDFFFFNCLVST